MAKWIVAAVVLVTTAAVASTPGSSRDDLILDVPFVSQTEALCGGAAAAMVLRYWGARRIYAEDFASLVEDSVGGIRTGRLVADLERRGYRALPFEGNEALIRGHLTAGRPMIALVEDRPQRYHYVVLVGWRNGSVILHDPATAPFRVVPARRFDAAWAATGRWSLLVLPGARAARSGSLPAAADSTVAISGLEVPVHTAGAPPDSIARLSVTYASLVAEAVRFGRAGDLNAAGVRLRAATAIWPDSAAAWRELAGIRFRQKQWSASAGFARRAARLDSDDAHTWRLLGASSFLEGRTSDALDAWNRAGEPHLDLTRIDGLKRTRFEVVSNRLGLNPGSLLTARSFRRAGRRLADFPVFESSRLDLRPLPGGIVEIDAAIVERPLFLGGFADAAILALRTFSGKELEVSLASPVGSGALWTAAWRWEANRPRVRVAVSGPGVAGLPGILSVEGFYEEQTYDAALVATVTPAGRAIPQGTDSTSAGTVRETRRHAGVGWREWLSADLRGEVNLGLDQWERQGSRFFSVGIALDLRPFHNTVSLRIQAVRWLALGRGRSFAIGTVDADWRSRVPGVRHTVVEARVGYRASGADAPPALWPGTGTGRGRADLLRAHPLLEGGVIRGPAFGRSLWSTGLEFDYRPWRLGYLRAGIACFVDAVWSGGRPAVPTRVDAGVGFRLFGFGSDGELSLDVAHGLLDRAAALSLVWRVKRR